MLSHQPASVIFSSCTVFKELLKTPKHDTKKDKLVSIYESLTAVLYWISVPPFFYYIKKQKKKSVHEFSFLLGVCCPTEKPAIFPSSERSLDWTPSTPDKLSSFLSAESRRCSLDEPLLLWFVDGFGVVGADDGRVGRFGGGLGAALGLVGVVGAFVAEHVADQEHQRAEDGEDHHCNYSCRRRQVQVVRFSCIC